MRHAVLYLALVYALIPAGVLGEAAQVPAVDATLLATVRIPTSVLVGQTMLPPGTYELRLTKERPAPLAGQPANAQEWVDFVVGGKVVAREAAEVLHDDDLTPVGASSRPVPNGARVDLLQGGEFVRVSVKRDRERYLIHLPVRR